jgi:hypothetical protein
VFHGSIYVFYRDDTGGDLRRGRFDGSTWRFRTIDGATNRDGRISADLGEASVAATFGGRLEVFYLDETDLDVRHASYDGAAWTFSTLDGDSTAAGHTVHEVGFNLAPGIWGGSLHVVYFERDPAYGAALGWAREAVLDGTAWTYIRAFRVNTIDPDKTLALGVVADDDVIAAYGTTQLIDTHLRWRRWDGVAWSDSTLLTDTIYGDPSAPALFVVDDGYPTLTFHDGAWGDAPYFVWSGGTITRQGTTISGAPTSSVAVDGTPSVYWGAADPTGCCRALLLRTSRP